MPEPVVPRTMQSVTITLTDDQKQTIKDFWNQQGSVGTAELKVEIVDGCVSPASIQVGTAK